MAHVLIDQNNKVYGIFARPQGHLSDYQEISDDDQRIADFLAAQEAENVSNN